MGNNKGNIFQTGGVSQFLNLEDVNETSYAGEGGNVVTVKGAEDGLEFTTLAGGGNVSADANITDNAIVRGDGGAKKIQDSVVTISDTGVIAGATQLTVDNIDIDGNTISSTAGDINIIPLAGEDVVIDGHFEFDGNLLTALTDNNTVITAFAGKNITIESVTFDAGVIAGVTTINGVTPENHSARHEDTGADEINVAGLSGELADDQPPKSHDNTKHSTPYLAESIFDAQSVVIAVADNTPVVQALAEQTLLGRLTGGNVTAISMGIADNNIVQIDHATVADNDYAKFTANGLEGRSYAEALGDFSGQAAGSFSWNSQNLTSVGAIGCNEITIADGHGLNLQEDISFTGATTENQIKMPDNLADALSIQEGTNKYITFVTTNSSEQINVFQDIFIDENAIKLDEALSADGTYSGITHDGVAGTTVAFGDLVYMATGDQRWELADADAEATAGDVILRLALSAGNDGDTILLLKEGFVREDDWNFTSYGQALYVSTTAGDMTQTAPSATGDIVRVVGYAHDNADTIYFNPDGSWVEIS